ncbi:Zn(2+) transporter ZRT3 NDAI_0A00880 [Naumovozyma dairenensis CBS 421]|uniref:Zinc/iron permease n=1 Tax=Naumovozyma dairenensis (strain ATCC 10597 / BCRC 20456 / CBS 421 / NBRC 0211 / NRRL Y-12639) TaxID=1071378 RepID=G0W358_NAUDC|nr:hypothetical protein NDAI_0A00880 [Naumovozyma dairenensis CBS 421]CCD22246.1 hypothetical protein NDAI_0A00880 [Naumovozyma dairenensis CBS 421]
MLSEMPRWLLYSLISSILCIMGSLCVPLLSVIFKTKQHHNSRLVNYGLSLSAGSMIATSLAKMLPEVTEDNKYTVFFGFMGGICGSLFLNYLVHAFASESLIHCSHDEVDESTESSTSPPHINETSAISHDNSVNDYASISNNTSLSEHDPLLRKSKIHDDIDLKVTTNKSVTSETEPYSALTHKKSLIDLISHHNLKNMGGCSNSHHCSPLISTESVPCIPPAVQSSQSIKSAHSLNRNLTNESEGLNSSSNNEMQGPCGVRCLENNIGYDLENLSIYRKNFLAKDTVNSNDDEENRSISSYNPISSQEHQHSPSHSHSHSHSHGDRNYSTVSTIHHHHLETPFSKLLSIGMQTCLVLTLHKFPEGFIIYYTNTSDMSESLGFSIFLSLTIHNFVEGFAMTLPFYTAFQSKWIAIVITTILGGGSQPMGALLGYLIFRNKERDGDGDQPLAQMDFLLSLTAGFLLVIGLQMFQTGVGFSDGHHHHQDEDEEEIQQSHSSGTTCLKWCCAGTILIIASSMFT